jgi:RHS repeat-associated protein
MRIIAFHTQLRKGHDPQVRSIQRSYDTMRRLQSIRLNSTTDGGMGNVVRNEIYFEFDETLGPKKVYQSHEGAKAGSTPYVEYMKDLSATGGIYDDLAHVYQVRYPSSRYVSLEFGTSDSIEDPTGRVSRVKGNLKDAAPAYTNYVTYNYTGAGRVVRTYYETPQIAGAYDVDGSAGYEFLDRFGRIVTRDWRVGASLRDQVTYTYDFAGNRLSRDIPTSLYATYDQDQAYTYDGRHRLLHVDQGTWNGTSITSKKFAQHWTLDGLGNWDNGPTLPGFQQDNNGDGTYELNQTRTHNTANDTLTASTWASPLHDAAGNMTTIPQPSSPGNSFALKYDAWNRLVQVTTGSVATYEYDGLGRRIAKVSGGVTEDYYYNTNYQIIEFRRGGVMREQLGWNVDYIDSLALRFNDGNSDGDFLDTNEQHYALQDGNYNVTALADSTGAVFERYRYTPYGERKVLEANFTDDPDAISDVLNTHTYTGRQLDSETGLYYYRARYYHALLGRFVARDPISYYGGNWNLFEYVRGNPIISLDPKGLLDWILNPDGTYTLRSDRGTVIPFQDTNPESQTQGRYQCHSLTFGCDIGPVGPVIVGGSSVTTILVEDGWMRIPACKAIEGDIIIWQRRKNHPEGPLVIHSAVIVSAFFVDGGNDDGELDPSRTTVNSKGGQFNPPDLGKSLDQIQSQYGGFYEVFTRGQEGGWMGPRSNNENLSDVVFDLDNIPANVKQQMFPTPLPDRSSN